MPWHFGPSAVQLDAMFNHERSRRDIDVPATLSPAARRSFGSVAHINAAVIRDDGPARIGKR
jgi:hypothetical protein